MDAQILKELLDKGGSTYSIAKELNIGQTSVRYWLKKYSLNTNKKIVTIQNNEKTCTCCNRLLSLKEFYKKPPSNYHTYCISCFNKKAIERQRNIKKLAVEYKGGKCEKCGYNKYLGALHFHHLNPIEKDINWKNYGNRKFDKKFKKEIDKCILLCANCHSEIHNCEL